MGANSRKTKRQAFRVVLARTAIDPGDAEEWGLVHEIRQQLFETGAKVLPIPPNG